MTKAQLIERLADIEWEDFEVKAAKSAIPKDSWETVSAFSNTAGGWLIFGISQTNNKYNIEGVDDPEKVEQDFTTTLRGEKFNVKIRPICKKYAFDQGTVLAFYIPLSNKKPIYYGSPTNAYYRTASGDQRATKEEVDAMYRDQAFGTRTSVVIDDYDVSKLNNHSVERYRDYMSRFNPSHSYNKLTQEELLNKLQIIEDGKLTYAGLLFLGKNEAIQRIFPDFRIDLLEIPGTSYSDSTKRYTYRMEEQENLWEYYFTSFERIRQKVDIPFKMNAEGFAVEDYPYLEALREALVNVLMHADYFSPAKPRIRIFNNRIEFYNPGGLPTSLQKLMEIDTSMPRNPILAKSFRAVKLAENAGFGIDKMIDGWKTYNITPPIFDIHIDATIVSFMLKPTDETIDNPDNLVLSESATKGCIKDGAKGGIKGDAKGGIKGGAIGGTIGGAIGGSIGGIRTGAKGGIKGGTRRLTKKQNELLEMIKEDRSLTIDNVAERFGINRSAAQKRFDVLKGKGIIQRIGGTGGYWKVLVEV